VSFVLLVFVSLPISSRNSIYIISSSSKVCPLYSGFPSPKKFRHLSLSLVSFSVSPWFVMLRLTPSIHLSLSLPLLRVPYGSHSKIFRGSLFPGILFTCPNHRSRFSLLTSKMFFPTSMITLMVTFRTFSFLDFHNVAFQHIYGRRKIEQNNEHRLMVVKKEQPNIKTKMSRFLSKITYS
jgi:hypothetical protein